MPYRKKTGKSILSKGYDNTNTNKTQMDIHKIVDSKKFEFFELEAFQVEEVLLDKNSLPNNDYSYYGAISGHWLNEPNQPILPNEEEWVLPLDPHIRKYPIVGEIVVCQNYLNRTYYSHIINVKNQPNNNIKWITPKSGAGINYSGNIVQTTDEDLSFRRNVSANPGDIIIQGRFGSSIKVGKSNRDDSPTIQLVAGHNTEGLELKEPVDYDIEELDKSDDASIYIQGKGSSVAPANPNSKLSSMPTQGSVIVLDADTIVLNAKQVLRMQSGELVEITGKDIETTHNADGTIHTGKKDEAIDNLRSRALKLLKRELEKGVNELREQTGLTQEDFDKLKVKKEESDNAEKPDKETVDAIRQPKSTISFPEYDKLVQDWNTNIQKLQDDKDIINQKHPPGSPAAGEYLDRGVGRVKVFGKLIDVGKEFVKGDFLIPNVTTE
jgi:hypothetical protein